MESARSGAGVKVVKPLVEEDEQNLPNTRAGLLQIMCDAVQRNLGRFLDRIAVGAGAYGREAHGSRPALVGQLQTLAIAIGQLRRLAMLAVLKDRPDCVNHILGRKRAGGGDDGAASGTAT